MDFAIYSNNVVINTAVFENINDAIQMYGASVVQISASGPWLNYSMIDDVWTPPENALISLLIDSSHMDQLSSGQNYFVDTTTSSVTLYLSASPQTGDYLSVFDATNSASINNIVISPSGNKINGEIQDLLIDENAGFINLVYTASTFGWLIAI